MKLLISSPYDLAIPGGVNHQVLLLATELRRLGHDITVVAPGLPVALPKEIKFVSTGKTVAFPFAHGSTAHIQIKANTAALENLFTQNHFDGAILNEPLMPGLNWWILKNTPGLVKIGTFHAYHPFNLKYFLGRPFLKSLFKKLNGWVAVSQAARHNVGQFFKATYQIIPNAIPLPAVPEPTQRNGLLFLGRFEPRKGLDILIRAFNQIPDPQLELFVVGRGDPQPYQNLLNPAYHKRVHFLGGIDDATLSDYFKKCRIFISPARGFESFGIVLIQALSFGLPVIASDIPGYRDVIGLNQGGVLVPKNNPQALARQIQSLLANPQELDHMSKCAYLRAAEFDIRKTAQSYLEYLLALRPKGQS